MSPLNVPVLLITYKRLETTQRVLDSIAKVAPAKLYIASNAPNPLLPDDEAKVKEVRDFFEKRIDWPCRIIKLYRTEHVNAKESISSAITWFFDNEPEGIILEDDCVVDASFYFFAQECLAKYRHRPEVFQISASNFQKGCKRGDASYYFSRYNHIWGWAGWRRSWRHYASFSNAVTKETHKASVYRLFSRKQDRTYWMAMYNYISTGNIDTWDYQWMFCAWAQGGHAIIPSVNLVENIGFGKEATNTLNPTKDVLSLRAHSLPFPVLHPAKIQYDDEADDFTSDNFFFISRSYRFHHLKVRIAALLSQTTKKKIKKIVLRLRNAKMILVV